MKEIWKDIEGYEGLYQVSNMGRVKSLMFRNNICSIPRERIMSFTIRSGYRVIVLRKNRRRKSQQVHRLVAKAFIPNPNNLPIVNHKDFNKQNNNVQNLEWCTQKENVKWSIKNMKKRKSKIYSNTGYKYIHHRKMGKGTFQVTVDGKYIGDYEKLEDAIKIRNERILSNKKTKEEFIERFGKSN